MPRWRSHIRVAGLALFPAVLLAAGVAVGCGSPYEPPGGVIYYRTNFSDGTTGPLDVYAYGGGDCAPSSDYRDRGSAYSIKCTVPGGTGAAALQAWFGQGRLSGTPPDPSLDQDLFEEVRFVLGQGAAAILARPKHGAGWSPSRPGGEDREPIG